MAINEQAFTISEFGRRARITVRTLRFYEELELLVPSQQNTAGHRLYGLKELERLQQIQSLKFFGYSLQEIKSLILNNGRNEANQLEESLPIQLRLLTEKRDELNRAIEAVERVLLLLKEGKPLTWTILSSLIFQMEHEEEQKEWAKEYLSKELADLFFSLPKQQRNHMDMEMLDILADLKNIMKDGTSPESPEAFQVLIKLTELATKHIDDKEELMKELEKVEELAESEFMDFQFPNIFTSAEEKFLADIGEAMEKLYMEQEEA